MDRERGEIVYRSGTLLDESMIKYLKAFPSSG